MNIVSIPTNKGVRTFAISDIIRVEAISNYSKVYFVNEYPLTVAKVLRWFEEKLCENSFYRIHRGHIVNCIYITSILRDSRIILSNGEVLRVSNRKKTAFRNEFSLDMG